MAAKSTGRVLLAVVVLAVVTSGVAAFASVGAAGPAHAGSAASADVAQQECTFPFEGEDATGETVTIEEEPERIVTTAPSAAQTIWEIGAQEKVVGVSQHAMHLEGAEERETVLGEDMMTVDVETVVDLEPDLVLAPDVTAEEDVENLRDAGLTVYQFEEPATVEGVEDATHLVGELVGECDGAQDTVDWMNEELAKIEETVGDEQQPRTLYLHSIGDGPWTAGEGTFIGDAIEIAGGENLAGSAGIEGHQPISDEVVAAEDPEWIVVNDFDVEPPTDGVYADTTAIEEDNVVVVDANHVNQPTPRIVYAIQAMAEAFHTEAFEQTPSPTPDETATPTATPEETDTPTPDTDDETVPGFGLSVAVAGLVAALVALARRRL